jgi:pimeloyl-ACP methyl ester carboxylesterase
MNPSPIILPVLIVLVSLVAVALSIRRLRNLRQPSYGTLRRNSERVVLSLIILVSMAAAAGTTYNASALRYYRSIYHAPGTIYTVDGQKMHLYCVGEGAPTIVLESGLGEDSLIWGKVQPELSKTTRVCSYDRAGMGWSAPRTGPRDANQIADQLHALLQEAGVTGPIVLMGHSIGGIYVRAYASRHPQNVAGLIFVDSSTPLQQDRGSADLRAFMSTVPAYQYYFAVMASALGIPRAAGECSKLQAGFDEHTARMAAEDKCGMLLSELWSEYTSSRRSGDETIHSGPYGNLPILIFSQDPQQPADSRTPAKLAPEYSAVWNEMQEELKQLSTRSRRIIAKGSGHHVQIDRADLLNREVPIFIQQIRNDGPPPINYGSTETE